MGFTSNILGGVQLLTSPAFKDNRGRFQVCYSKQELEAVGIEDDFVQDNISYSAQHTLRGLHHQYKKPQAKLVQVIKGSVLDVVVDIRCDSPTFGQHLTFELNGDDDKLLYVPAGFAHGFLARTDCIFHYKCSEYYDPTGELSINFKDPDINIDWGDLAELRISEKDQEGISLQKWKHARKF
jgi:dTDP-4-dehydrorhamnose 3,5-epimerase